MKENGPARGVPRVAHTGHLQHEKACPTTARLVMPECAHGHTECTQKRVRGPEATPAFYEGAQTPRRPPTSDCNCHGWGYARGEAGEA